LNPELPVELEHIINKALEKDREVRYQHAADVRADLMRLKRDTDSRRLAPRATAPQQVSRAPWRWGILAASLLAVAILLALAWKEKRKAVPGQFASGQHHLSLVLSSQGGISDPDLSPDGKMIVYVAQGEGHSQLFLSRVAGGARVRLTNDATPKGTPHFSPDGERIAFARLLPGKDTPEVCVIPSLGGEPTPLIADAAEPVWSPDGSRLAVLLMRPGQPRSLATAAADGSDLQTVLRADDAYPGLYHFAWSPDSHLLAVARSTGGVAGEIWLVPAGGGKPRRLSNESPGVFSHTPVFTPDGSGLICSSNRGGATNLWFLPLEGGGTPLQLTSGPGPDESPSVARDGKILFLNSRSHNALLVYDLKSGRERELVTYAGFLWAPAFSPDGREIAFSQAEPDGAWHIWVVPTKGGKARRLSSGALPEIYPRFTPDGNSVIYFTWSPQRNRIWQVPHSGGPALALTPKGKEDETYGDVSPDGRWLAFAREEQNITRIYIAPMSGGEARRLTQSPSTLPRWSPNGQWIAFSPGRSFESGIFLIRADGTHEHRLTQTGSWPAWWPDGKRIAYLVIGPEGSQQIRTVPVEGGPSMLLSGLRFAGTNNPIDLSPDGTLIATSNSVAVSSEIWLLELQR
jgi:Tol biopolymer transport system component